MTTGRSSLAGPRADRCALLLLLLILVLAGRCGVAGDTSQCLPHDDTWMQLRDSVCSPASGSKRLAMVRKFYLPHCHHYKLWHVLNETIVDGIASSSDLCYHYLDHVLDRDKTVARFVCEFEDILQRYDCAQSFSIRSSCHKCKDAYRLWMCSMTLPWWSGNGTVKPCRGFCHEVERLCPYFLPAEKTGPGSQYAGEPSFLCIDPDVRETEAQASNSFYGDEKKCYRPCSLQYDLEPDVHPSQCLVNLIDPLQLAAENTTTWSDDSSVSNSACTDTNSYLQFGWRWRTAFPLLPWLLVQCVLRLFRT